jgi:hypothetical protein
MAKQQSDEFSLEEVVRRRDAVIKHMLHTPPKPHSEMKLGKPRGKPNESPAKRKEKKPGK